MEAAVDKSLYPVFPFFHDLDGEIIKYLIDPHNYSLADMPGKRSSLDRFARENPDVFHRVTAVIRNNSGVLKGLNLAGRVSTVIEG